MFLSLEFWVCISIKANNLVSSPRLTLPGVVNEITVRPEQDRHLIDIRANLGVDLVVV